MVKRAVKGNERGANPDGKGPRGRGEGKKPVKDWKDGGGGTKSGTGGKPLVELEGCVETSIGTGGNGKDEENGAESPLERKRQKRDDAEARAGGSENIDEGGEVMKGPNTPSSSSREVTEAQKGEGASSEETGRSATDCNGREFDNDATSRRMGRKLPNSVERGEGSKG